MAETSDSRQVATRVSIDAWKVLQIGLVIEEVDTMQDLLRPVVEDYAKRLKGEPEVKAMIKQAARYQNRTRGV